MPPEQPPHPSDAGNKLGTAEWVRAQLDRMHADMLAGKRFPEDRETILRRMGFGDYETYLYSPLWKRTRRRILKRDDHTCVRCSDKATQVHHLTYTESVLKGEDDSQLVSICAGCHERIEFNEDRTRRTDSEKRRLLEDRKGALEERAAAERARIYHEQLTERVRTAAGGRCFRCKGDTEHQLWHSDGRVYSLPQSGGEHAEVWMCSGCRSELDHTKEGKRRTDEEKLALMGKKVNVRYTRPAPTTGFSFRKTFWRLNAMQREGVMNEFHWNAANIRNRGSATMDPSEFEQLRERYESTKANGRGRAQQPL